MLLSERTRGVRFDTERDAARLSGGFRGRGTRF